MKLLHLTTQGVAGLPDRTYEFADPSTGAPFDVVFVTGLPASGKTRLLEAILAAKEDVGPYGVRPRAAALVREGAASATIQATWLLSPAERARAELRTAAIVTTSVFGDEPTNHPEALSAIFRDYTRSVGRWKVEYFHAGRHLPAGAGVAPVSDAAEARLRVGKSGEKYRGVRAYLVEALLGDAMSLATRARNEGLVMRAGGLDALGELRELLRPFLQDKVLDGIEPARDGYRVRFRNRGGSVVDLDALSSAEQQGVLFAVTSRRLGLEHALVLIDAPELHVHPSRQLDFFRRLTALGRDNQIIAATTSSEILAQAPRAQILDLGSVRGGPLG